MGKRMLEMDILGRRESGRPKRWLMDELKDDMQVVGVTEEAGDRVRWR